MAGKKWYRLHTGISGEYNTVVKPVNHLAHGVARMNFTALFLYSEKSHKLDCTYEYASS